MSEHCVFSPSGQLLDIRTFFNILQTFYRHSLFSGLCNDLPITIVVGFEGRKGSQKGILEAGFQKVL